jgi:excisionase family DNA binding protein
MDKTELKELIKQAVREVLSERQPDVIRRDMLSVEDVVKMLKVSRLTVYNYTKQGLPFVKNGRRLLFKESDVIDWIERAKEGKKEVNTTV